jgi:hypothetical protein
MKLFRPLIVALLMAGCSKPEPSLLPESSSPPRDDDCARHISIDSMTLGEAERILRCTTVFASGRMPDKAQVRAFNLLFEQPDAVERFRVLSREGQTAGRLYALAGLLLLDAGEGKRVARELSGRSDTLTVVESDVVREGQPAPEVVAAVIETRLGHELRSTGRQWQKETRPGSLSFCGARSFALPQHGPRLPPRDEAASRPDFLAFRDQLLAAVAKKDTRRILRMANPRVMISLGRTDGVAALEGLIANPTQDFWGDFGRTLAMGGTFDDQGRFSAPYVYSTWPGGFDVGDCMAVIAHGVPLRDKPAETGRTLAGLDYDIVELVGQYDDFSTWQQVRLATGRTGFVESKFLRSSTSYHARFALSGGAWHLEQFVFGG